MSGFESEIEYKAVVLGLAGDLLPTLLRKGSQRTAVAEAVQGAEALIKAVQGVEIHQ